MIRKVQVPEVFELSGLQMRRGLRNSNAAETVERVRWRADLIY